MYDVIIVGGGPAGLSAALVLGRCRRRVLVCDAGRPRNAAAKRMHGFLTRDGTEPGEVLRLGREEVLRYGVEFRQREVTEASCQPDGCFEVVLDDDSRLECRKLLLATGVQDEIPDIPGAKELYGASVFHCPYCDGYEHRSLPMVAYGPGRAAVGLALSLRTWSSHVTACTDGRGGVRREDLERLAATGIAFRPERITRLVPNDGKLQKLTFESGPELACSAFFFNTGQHVRSRLALRLGCKLNRAGGVKTNGRQNTDVPGLFLAGDAAREVQFVVVAAAEGATAAVAINRELQDEDRGERKTGCPPDRLAAHTEPLSPPQDSTL